MAISPAPEDSGSESFELQARRVLNISSRVAQTNEDIANLGAPCELARVGFVVIMLMANPV
jgi:hypothetical protein